MRCWGGSLLRVHAAYSSGLPFPTAATASAAQRNWCTSCRIDRSCCNAPCMKPLPCKYATAATYDLRTGESPNTLPPPARHPAAGGNVAFDGAPPQTAESPPSSYHNYRDQELATVADLYRRHSSTTNHLRSTLYPGPALHLRGHEVCVARHALLADLTSTIMARSAQRRSK